MSILRWSQPLERKLLSVEVTRIAKQRSTFVRTFWIWGGRTCFATRHASCVMWNRIHNRKRRCPLASLSPHGLKRTLLVEVWLKYRGRGALGNLPADNLGALAC
eukprot:6178535-Pleurochrysis_carterae.AAC.1